MTTLEWGKPGDKKFQAGVDRGVVYPRDEFYPPVAWNGLSGVNVTSEGGQLIPVFVDGYVRAFDVTPGRFKAVLECFDYPEAIASAVGDKALEEGVGVYATNQEIDFFDFCWRTGLGDDLTAIGKHYKIHLVYEAIALPSASQYTTVSDNTEPLGYSFDIDAVPQDFEDGLPTAYFVVNTKTVHPRVLADLEAILYGDVEAPRMPTPTEVETVINQSPPVVFTNLATNPSFETASTMNQFHSINVIPNPFGSISYPTPGTVQTTESEGWGVNHALFGTGATGTRTILGSVELDGVLFPQYIHKEWTAAPTADSDLGFAFTSLVEAEFPVALTGSMSFYWRSSLELETTLSVYYYDGTTLVHTEELTLPVNTADIWQRDSITFEKPSGADTMQIVHHVEPDYTDAPIGTYIDVTGVMVNEEEGVIPFFGGDVAVDQDLVSNQLGDPGLASSVALAWIPDWVGYSSNATLNKIARATSDLADRGFALRLAGNYDGTSVAVLASDDPSIDLGLVRGATYVVEIDYFSDAWINEIATRGLTLVSPSTGGTVLASAEPENRPGEIQRLSMEFTVPEGITTWELRVNNGEFVTGPDAYFDRLSITTVEEAPYAALTGYIDGETRNGPWDYGEWTGDPDASTSIYRSFDLGTE